MQEKEELPTLAETRVGVVQNLMTKHFSLCLYLQHMETEHAYISERSYSEQTVAQRQLVSLWNDVDRIFTLAEESGNMDTKLFDMLLRKWGLSLVQTNQVVHDDLMAGPMDVLH